MRKISCWTITMLVLLSSNGLAKKVSKEGAATHSRAMQIQSIISPATLFTQADAEKILGEPCHLEDSATTVNNDALQYKSSHQANAKDPKTGKTGNVYYLFERYNRATTAHEIYTSFKTGNQSHEGFTILNDLGDEAYFHSDGENFLFIIVRKGVNMFRIKVNKTTSTTSLDEFNRVARDITASL